MPRRFGSEHVSIANATLTSGSGILDVIIAPQTNKIIGINQFIVSNQLNQLTDVTLYDGASKITPEIPVGGSGTIILDEFGGNQLELSLGSGLYGTLNITGEAQITVYYVLHDLTPPSNKDTYRAATYNTSPKATRTPGVRGIGAQS